MRKVEVNRSTKETDVRVVLTIEGKGSGTIRTGIPFFDHMLHAMAKHAGFDLVCRVKGDLGVDSHHTIEDTGIVLGDAIRQAIGGGKGIRRFGHAIIPMDESLAQVALDCGGRGYLVFSGSFNDSKIGGIQSDIFEHFFHSGPLIQLN
jgi:imidazoleglycerol-phosphate dehydratase